MTAYQQLWWEQVRSDYDVFVVLRRSGSPPCHALHYLQMVTEKLGKAYLWRTGHPPSRNHAAFVPFLQALNSRSAADRTRAATHFGLHRAENLKDWIRSVLPLAYDLQRLAPALAGDTGPNPEYPWPQAAPVHSPVSFTFPIWGQLTDTGAGHNFMRFIDAAVRTFPVYA